MISQNNKLFSWIYDVIISEGGDGDAVLGFKHQDYKDVANEFKEWLGGSPFFKMEEKEQYIIFSCDQEYFIFTSSHNFPNISNYGPRILTW